jgi:F-type H+-transporting ATPase subunit delta
MADQRNRAYAAAVVAVAEAEKALDTVEDELLQVARALDDNRELREKLTDIHLPVGRRLEFVDSDALKAAHPATRSALALLIGAGRIGQLGEIAKAVAEQAAAAREQELAEVHVAVKLTQKQQDALRKALEQATGKKLDLKIFVDPDVIGGVRARVGDTVIDGSVAKRLSDIRARLGR